MSSKKLYTFVPPTGPAGTYAQLPEAGQLDPDGEAMSALSDAPLKLDMTRPESQAQAADSWGNYRSQIGTPMPGGPSGPGQKPYQAKMNMARITQYLREKYVGWSDDDIRNHILSEEGLRPNQANLVRLNKMSEAPGYIQDVLNGGAGAVTASDHAIPSPSTTYMPPGKPSPMTDLGLLAHETVHSWADLFRPKFHANPGQSAWATVNNLGEEAAPHFPDGLHDRGMVDALAADKRAKAYGGYPKSIRPQNPWPMARRPIQSGTPAPQFEQSPALLGDTSWSGQ